MHAILNPPSARAEYYRIYLRAGDVEVTIFLLQAVCSLSLSLSAALFLFAVFFLLSFVLARKILFFADLNERNVKQGEESSADELRGITNERDGAISEPFFFAPLCRSLSFSSPSRV